MKVTRARSAGFCFGVERAVDQVYQLAKKYPGQIYTYGPIIHNEQVVEDLDSKGVKVVETIEDLDQLKEGIVVIRSHGVAREVIQAIEKKGLRMVDATCPFVKKIHNIVEKESGEGRQIVIIGNDHHPEVEGIKGWSLTPALVVGSREEAKTFAAKENSKVCIVSQTTFNYNYFQEIVEIIREKGYDIIVLNTICNATSERQAEAEQLAKKVDCMIVIGGRNSSNTQKLYDICSKQCRNTYFIQTLVDLENKPFQSTSHVGITAGASTPKNIIEEVQKHVGTEF